MVDEEVESTLREIRERVRAAAEQPTGVAHDAAGGANAVIAVNGEATTRTPEAIARIDAYLHTTARAWDRLPPLVSNRSGELARWELWVKRRLKQATRWYAWEQINFNAAVHHALRDTLDTLLDFEHHLRQLQAKLSMEGETRAQHFEQNRTELMTQRAKIESQRAALESQRAQMEAYRAQFDAEKSATLESQGAQMEAYRAQMDAEQRAALESQCAQMEAYRAQMDAEQSARSLEMNARLADLTRELRERDGQRLEEQRVCFKQLSLEMSEAEVLLDRARRDIESRLDKLESPKRKS